MYDERTRLKINTCRMGIDGALMGRVHAVGRQGHHEWIKCLSTAVEKKKEKNTFIQVRDGTSVFFFFFSLDGIQSDDKFDILYHTTWQSKEKRHMRRKQNSRRSVHVGWRCVVTVVSAGSVHVAVRFLSAAVIVAQIWYLLCGASVGWNIVRCRGVSHGMLSLSCQSINQSINQSIEPTQSIDQWTQSNSINQSIDRPLYLWKVMYRINQSIKRGFKGWKEAYMRKNQSIYWRIVSSSNRPKFRDKNGQIVLKNQPALPVGARDRSSCAAFRLPLAAVVLGTGRSDMPAGGPSEGTLLFLERTKPISQK